jgi:hypothetical protein
MARYHGLPRTSSPRGGADWWPKGALTAAAGWRPPRSMRSRATGFDLSWETIDFQNRVQAKRG